MKKLEHSLNYLLKNKLKHNKQEFFIIYQLSKNWQKIIGKEYQQYCQPKSISLNSDKQEIKLTISAYNSAIAFFIENNTSLILERIAILYGFKAVGKIIIKQEPKNV
jgi:hypothetical protein